MKKLIAWSVCFVLGGNLMAQDGNGAAEKNTAPASSPAAAPAAQTMFQLSDGSRVVGAPVIDSLKITTLYATLDIPFPLLRSVEISRANHTAWMRLQTGELLSGRLAATEIAVKTSFGRIVIPMSGVKRIRTGHFGGVFVNSLGMKFVPVSGTDILFSVWDTRVRDYRAYAAANPAVDASWKNPGFEQGDDHPVVMVSWEEAKAFCVWLTQKERKEGKIAQDEEYRLPTDDQWSAAAGSAKYPWGEQWPPPKGAGNYGPALKADDYQYTSPVGSFAANESGLFDMGGNVWQWCEDVFRPEMNPQPAQNGNLWLAVFSDGPDGNTRVARGAAFDASDPNILLTSYHGSATPVSHTNTFGFRCVLVSGATAP